ncbi:MAG: alanine--glyoxylate aminotransferase family protein [Actinomycetota bacterium]|nr:alanine--glyoxylate aminotransferase family protein [Actinomycetota bacterium]MDI6821596.1 alanine--glyoxylate aminotransferase family protein [Actinomycetota bacterium]
MKKEYLMTPGPTPVPTDVLLAQARCMIHHRTPLFTETLLSLIGDLKYIFQTKNDVLIFASSGTGAMESAVVNLFSPGDKVIAASNGKFGDRFIKLAEVYGLNVAKLEYEWNKVVNPDDIANLLEKDKNIKGILVVQSETSTGILNDIKTIGEIVEDHPAVLVVDSITGIGAVECKTDEWHLDVVMTGSQKGLMLPPGLACVSVSDKAWEAVERSTLPKFYFSYKKYRDALGRSSPQTPFTPPISLMMALREALRLIREEGLENVIRRHAILAEAVRQGVQALGLELFAPPGGRGNAVTPVKVPQGIDGTKIVKIMRDKYGITIAGGQEHLKGKIFRIGHLGYFDRFDIITTLSGLESTLSELGYPLEFGTAIKAAEEVFRENPL